MRWSSRLFAAAAGQPARRIRRATISLDHFIQRQRALSLWREIVRATNKIPKSGTRDELRSFARHEFERNKDVTDLVSSRSILDPEVENPVTGKTEFDAMRRYIDEQAA
ncbi:hypothetical protein FQN53_009568 [Emmonsiellopsis sp. PD_33]|nr:hypothetical protein FQN53_009568 [Emmonsiellopsis sp. PD_33]